MFDQLLKRYSPFTNLCDDVPTVFQHPDNRPTYSASENVGCSVTMNESEEHDFMVVDKMLASENFAIQTEKPVVDTAICSPLVSSNSHSDVSVLDDIEEDFMVVDKPQTENLAKTAINSAPDAVLNNGNSNGTCSIIDETEEDFFMVDKQETQSAKCALSVNHSVGAIDNVTVATTRSDSNEFVIIEQIDYNPFAGNTDGGRILGEIERYFMTIDNPMNYVDPNSRLTKPISTEIGTSGIFIDNSATTPAICLVDHLGNFSAVPVILFKYICIIATASPRLVNCLAFSTAAPNVDNEFVLVNESPNAAARPIPLVKHIRKFAVFPSYLVGRLCIFTTANAARCVFKMSAAVSRSNLVRKSFRTFTAARNSTVNDLYKMASTPIHLVNCVGATIANVKVNATRKSAAISSSGPMAESLYKFAAFRTSMANGLYKIAITPVCLVKRLVFSAYASTHINAPAYARANGARRAPKKSTTVLGSGLVTKSLRKIAAAHTSMANCLYIIAITPGHLVHCIGVNIANANGNACRKSPAVSTAGPMTKTLHTFAAGRTFMVNGLYKTAATPAQLLNYVGATIGISKKNITRR